MGNKYKIKLFLLIIALPISLFGQEEDKDNIIEIKMDSILNRNIQLRITYEDKNFNNQVLYIPGKLDKNIWKFCFPDSIDGIRYLSLSSPMENDSIEKMITLVFISGKDTLKCGSFNFKKGHSILTLKYQSTDVSHNILYLDKMTGNAKFKKIYLDDYIIEETNDVELLSSMKGIAFSSKFYNDKIPYENKMKEFISLAKEYPNSNSLIIELESYMTAYNSKEDVANIYKCFSDEAQKTYYGRKINHYLNQKIFDNTMLPAWDTEIPELIIKDNTKYNLVVFSASWCAPCHKMIPILKQIYNDLNHDINIVYVSVDEDKTAKLWKELMEKEEIPWRSVLSKGQVNLIKDKYSVQGIPCTLLVNPRKEIQRVELRDEKEKMELYRLFNKKP